jgi:hypothetical protein
LGSTKFVRIRTERASVADGFVASAGAAVPR